MRLALMAAIFVLCPLIMLAATQAPNPNANASESTTAESSTTTESNSAADSLTNTDETGDGAEKTEPASTATEPKEANGNADESLSTFRMTEKKVDEFCGQLNEYLAGVLFFPVPIPFTSKIEKKLDADGNAVLDESGETIYETKDQNATVPLSVFWLIIGATFFTIRMSFINIRGFKHAIMVTAGKFDNPDDEGEVSHFQALMSALSATVGLGNIAGVAIAIMTGGPGATFWMIVAGFLGMTSKFVECTLGQKYREVRPDGRVMGGAMFYLSRGLGNLGIGPIGKALAVLFAVLCIGGSLGGGNAFQVNQSLNAVQETLPAGAENYRWVYGIIMTIMVGIVIIGGIRRIAKTAEKIVPTMCGIYVLAAIVILIMKAKDVPDAFTAIWEGAFSAKAMYGGAIGVLITGFKRAAFSNEAGVGSAAIAHSVAKTEHPVREGVVALLGPFIDTVVICTMTALVIVITGAYQDKTLQHFVAADNGAGLTSHAMNAVIPGFKYMLAIAVVLFAYSTMISWSFYGERCWAYLFGDRASMSYRIIFLIFVFLGSIVSAKNVKDFSDLMILGMAIPNIIGLVLLSNEVRKDMDAYWQRYKSGEFKIMK